MVAHALRCRCCRLEGSRRSRGLAPGASDTGKLAAAAFPDSPVCTSSACVADWSDQIHRTHRGTRLIEHGHIVVVLYRDRAKAVHLDSRSISISRSPGGCA